MSESTTLSSTSEVTVTSTSSAYQPLSPELSKEVWITLKFTHAGKEYTIDLAESDRVDDLKVALESLTGVPPERMKILGLVKGKLPPDQATIKELNLTSGKKFTLVGTPQGQEHKAPEKELPDTFNQQDVDLSVIPEVLKQIQSDLRNQRKIKEAIKKTNVNIMNPLRPGMGMLVLDLDYTILDTERLTSGMLPPHECARPGLHEFLEAVYPYYDICIWSQTSWRWLETKLVELGMVGDVERQYKIAFVLDKGPMFKVFSKREGKDFTHHVKPLKLIWELFPQYSERNTIHIDDLSRNFALNPGSGLKISPFKHAHTEQAMQDKELEALALYLIHLHNSSDGREPDFRAFDHKNWKKIVKQIRSSQALVAAAGSPNAGSSTTTNK